MITHRARAVNNRVIIEEFEVPFTGRPAESFKSMEQRWLNDAREKLKEVYEFRQQQLLPYVSPTLAQGYNQTLDGIDCTIYPLVFPKEASHEDQARTSDLCGVRNEDTSRETADTPRYVDMRKA